MEFEKILGEELRKIRVEKGLSQEALGFESDYHRTYISQIERGEKNVSFVAIFKIANALDIKLSELIRNVEERV
jgi:transcriptional regulator with XRE-family HTH domain